MTGLLPGLRRRLLAARLAYWAFLMPHPDVTECPFNVCDGTGVLSIVELDQSYEQECACAPLLPTVPRHPRTRLDAYRRQQAKTNRKA